MTYYYQHVTHFDNGNTCVGEVTDIDLATTLWNEEFCVSNTAWQNQSLAERQAIAELFTNNTANPK